jgi:UDP-glucose 4-epimerase
MTRWLVTGGCGFIGRNLIQHLLSERRYQIRVLDNLMVGRREDLTALAPVRQVAPEACGADALEGGIELVLGDVRDAGVTRASARGRDVIVHLAGNTGVEGSVRDPLDDCTANVLGTLNCLEAARHEHVPRFVFASSGAPVGEVEPPIHEEQAPRPVSPYGASKLAAEGYCSAYFRTFGVETVALRFGNVYGPNSAHKTSVVAAFISRALAGAPLSIYGDGNQTRDFIFVDDLLRAIMQAATVPDVGGHVFQIASARETTITELAAMLAHLLRERGLGEVRVVREPPRAGDVRRNYSDTSKAARLLHWRPEVPLAEGLGRVIEWFVTTHRAGSAARAGESAGTPSSGETGRCAGVL